MAALTLSSQAMAHGSSTPHGGGAAVGCEGRSARSCLVLWRRRRAMEKEEGDVLQIRKGVSCFWPHDCDPSRGLRETGVTVRPAKKVTKDDDDDAGPRINNDITAPFLRLVTDEGHSVVPRHETLQLAARMGLDLVEVHRKTDPPVCKIMDFHKEKYNKDVKEKERLKTKSAIVLHGGDNKEVRFKAKTEIKDLKVKADAITRLMERGYRVKAAGRGGFDEHEGKAAASTPLSLRVGFASEVVHVSQWVLLHVGILSVVYVGEIHEAPSEQEVSVHLYSWPPLLVWSLPCPKSVHALVLLSDFIFSGLIRALLLFAPIRDNGHDMQQLRQQVHGNARSLRIAFHKSSSLSTISPIEQIQDVSIVESGPHLDSKHAYVIVRHVKFATKKGGKKASKAMEDAGKGTPSNTACESPATATNSGDKTSEHGLEVEDVDKTPAYYSRDSLAQKERQDRGVGGSNRDNMDNVSAGGNRINPSQGGSQSSEHGLGSRSGNSHMEKREKTNQDMVPEQTNRYASRRQQMGGVNQGRPPQDPRRNENEGRHRFNGNQRPLEQPSPPSARFSQGRPPQDPRRNENEARHRFNDNQRPLEQSSPPSPRLGQGRPPQDPRRNERRSHVPSSNNNQPPRFQQSNQNSGPLAGRDAGSPTPTARSLGVFSSRTQATTSEPKKADGASAAGKPSDTSPTKSFGIFSTPRK
ncbi:uncharacterized protein [Aegilops tauschii subsp. strangulata]|uniref:uncharacterized protein n=1 Tax=Aegilops tauschii subsp. strangulata TaxID=200361 RepID=UPI003CC84120